MVEEKSPDPIRLEVAVARAIVPPKWGKSASGAEGWLCDPTRSPHNGMASAFEEYNLSVMAAIADAINAIVDRLEVIEARLGIIQK